MRNFEPFALERLMSQWEHAVDYNMTSSGVCAMSASELIQDHSVMEEVLSTKLEYPPTNGLPELRERIAALYPGATPDNVLVTVGCIEANYAAVQTILAAGDEMVMMLPNYMQVWGLGQNFGLEVGAFHLDEQRGWALDVDELNDAVSEATKLIAVCNPNNPTGHVLSEAEMDAVVAAAERAGAWILADEIYSGAERLTDQQTPSFWGRYDKVLASNSLSKAYGLPGLRIGWVVAPVDTVDLIWARHDYLTISVGMLAGKLAAAALSPEVRPRLLSRGRACVQRGFQIVEGWISEYEDTFSVVPPHAGAICFAKHNLGMDSREFVDRLIREKSVLLVPGDTFGFDGHLRIGFGMEPDFLRSALDRVGQVVEELRS